jgi:hypothetical protein
MTVDDLIGAARTLDTAIDARHVLACDRVADMILADDAWLESDLGDLVTLDPRRRDAALRHAIRDALRADAIAVNQTGLRRASRVGSGRKAKSVPGGYVERAYAAIVHPPAPVSARRLASESLEDRAKRVAWETFASDARHSTTLFASAVAYGWEPRPIVSHRRGRSGRAYGPRVVTPVSPETYAASHGRTATETKLRHPMRLRAVSARNRRGGRDDSTTTETVTYYATDRPSPSDRVTHAASFLVPVGSSHASVAAYVPSPDVPRSATVGTVTHVVGPWATDAPDGRRRYWHGHSVVTISPRVKRNTRRKVDLSMTATVRDAVARVLATREAETITVRNRPVEIRPAKRGTVSWRTTTRQGQGKDAARVAGRIVAAVAP